MRPSARALWLVGGALALSLLGISAPALSAEIAIFVWSALVVLMLTDFVLSPRADGLLLVMDPPQDVFAGETARIPARLIRSGGPMPGIDAAQLQLDAELGGQLPVVFLPDAEGGAWTEMKVPAIKRGTFDLNTLWLRWTSRYGLWEVLPKLTVGAQLRVVPNIRPVTSGQINTIMRSELYGVKDTVMRGEGSEFHQLVDFTTGMDPRTIDWKRSARHRDLVSKEMRAERNHQIILCLDNGYLMRGEIDGLARIDHAINASLTVAWAAGIGGDMVGLYGFDAEPRLYTPPQPARAAFPVLRQQMAGMEYRSVESNHTLALAHLGGLLKRRSLIVIFSDFADTTTAELLIENLGVLHRTHVVLFVTLSDPALEAGQEGSAKNAGDVAEAVVTAELLRDRQLVLDRLKRLGVLCLETPPGTLSPRLLSAYIDIKAKELI